MFLTNNKTIPNPNVRAILNEDSPLFFLLYGEFTLFIKSIPVGSRKQLSKLNHRDTGTTPFHMLIVYRCHKIRVLQVVPDQVP